MISSETARAGSAIAGNGPHKSSLLGGFDGSQIARSARPFQGPRYEPQFRRQIERVHQLGPYALSCLLEAIAAGADLRTTVADYAALDAGFIEAHDGGSFPAAIRAIDGPRR